MTFLVSIDDCETFGGTNKLAVKPTIVPWKVCAC
jgi:hypothetical protein